MSAFGRIGSEAYVRIDAFDNCKPSVPDLGQDTNWTQQAGCVIDQIKKRGEARHSEERRDKQDQLMDILVHSVLSAERKEQCKDE